MIRILRITLTAIAALVAVLAALIGGLSIRSAAARPAIEQEWLSAQPQPLQNLGSTRSLTILPLVESEAAAGLAAERGVAYLIKTDQATILFDVGLNSDAKNPALLHNMQALGFAPTDFDLLVLSHRHPDHVGGLGPSLRGAFVIGGGQPDLGDRKVYMPTAMTYPGLQPIVAEQPQVIAPGVATLGAIPFPEVSPLDLLAPRNTEQSLAIHVEGQGLVILTGCGHPTVERIVARAHAVSDRPIIAIIGGLHYMDSDAARLEPSIRFLQTMDLRLVALSPHDSSPAARTALQAALPAAYRQVRAGEAIHISP